MLLEIRFAVCIQGKTTKILCLVVYLFVEGRNHYPLDFLFYWHTLRSCHTRQFFQVTWGHWMHKEHFCKHKRYSSTCSCNSLSSRKQWESWNVKEFSGAWNWLPVNYLVWWPSQNKTKPAFRRIKYFVITSFPDFRCISGKYYKRLWLQLFLENLSILLFLENIFVIFSGLLHWILTYS